MKKSSLSLSLFILLSVAMTGPVFAQFNHYLKGLQSDIQIRGTSVANLLNSNINVKKMSFWDRLTSPTATALYSPLFNTIKLSKELISPNGDIKDARQIRGPRYLTTPIVTVFHEMGHAELDTLIENSSDFEDVALMNLYRHTLKNKYAKNFKGARPYDIFHEHFAYYKTAVLEYMYNELSSIYMANGYNYIQYRCYLAPHVKDLLEAGASLEKFLEMQAVSNTGFYRKDIKVRYVFVKGKSYDLTEIPGWDKTKDLVHATFWNTLQKYYGFAINREQFVERMNRNKELKKFKECREKLYHDFNSL